MTSWIVSIAKGLDKHWDIAKAGNIWDLARTYRIRPGDRVYFWQAPNQGIVGYGLVSSVEDSPSATPWSDGDTHGYRLRLNFEHLTDSRSGPTTWGEFARTVGLTGGLNRVPEVSDSAAEGLLALLADVPNARSLQHAIDIMHNPGIEALLEDRRETATAQIHVRRGQPAFRRELLRAYAGTCAVTAAKAVDVLEAAHISGYLGAQTHIVPNGLLLRSDIHTLFDLKRITIGVNSSTEYSVHVDPGISDPEYRALDGGPLRVLPEAKLEWPDVEYLRAHQAKCAWFRHS